MRLRCIEIYVFMVDDYGVDEMLCRLHAGDGVEVRRAAVDGLEMWLVVLGDDYRVLEHSLQAVLHLEVEGVGRVGVAHRQDEAIYILVLVDENAVLAVSLRGRYGHRATSKLRHGAVQLILRIDGIVERTVERGASHHREDGQQEDRDYFPHLISFSI